MLQKKTFLMRFYVLFFFFLSYASSWSQFQFQGQVSEAYRNKPVYLSLIEDYRKTGRVYLDQIIQKTKADSLGQFSFSGEQLPANNHFYRIHTDGCDEEESNQHHFMGQCQTTMSVLFIANNQDTLSLPLEKYNQEFCEISSTNPSSTYLLEFEALKEEMILDFVGAEHTELAETLKFNKWFDTFHDFAKSTQEPLVELFVYGFLSDRSNETYESYKVYVEEHQPHINLANALSEYYPKTSYSTQFSGEMIENRDLEDERAKEDRSLDFSDFIPLLSFLGLAGVLLLFYKPKLRFSKRSHKENLTSQEQKVVNAIKMGKSNKEIAAELFISLSTVKTHINSIYKKLGVSSRKELLSKI